MAILNQDKMTSHRLGGRRILLLFLLAALWIPQTGQANTSSLKTWCLQVLQAGAL